MRIAVLGDVHGNRAALDAVIADVERWDPDITVSTGDVINRGPSSADCLALVEGWRVRAGWRALRGNHEDYVIHQSAPGAARSGPEFESFRQSYWTYQQIGRRVDAIRDWADAVEFRAPDGSVARVAHASMLGNNRGIFPDSSREELLRKCGDPQPAVFCGGHTHTAFIRSIDGTLFVNAGSVGIPFDGDWRAGYARLTWRKAGWTADIVRVSYDRQATIAEYIESGFLTEAGPIAWLVLAEYLNARSQLFLWHRDYFDSVLRGERGVEETVREQLARQGLWASVAPYLSG